MTKQEKVVEEITLLLLSLPLYRHEPHRTYEIAANEAADMAYRAYKAKTEDLSWWRVPGRPYFNKLMARLRRKVEKKTTIPIPSIRIDRKYLDWR